MAKGYWITTYRSVSNPDKVAAYAKLAAPAIAAGGGTFLVRGNPAKTFEKGLMERTVVTEWPSVERALEWYHSEEYREAKGIRQAASTGKMILIEGT